MSSYQVVATQTVITGHKQYYVNQPKIVNSITSELITAAQEGLLTITDITNSVAVSFAGFGSGLGLSNFAGTYTASATLPAGFAAGQYGVTILSMATRMNMLEAMLNGYLGGKIIPAKDMGSE